MIGGGGEGIDIKLSISLLVDRFIVEVLGMLGI